MDRNARRLITLWVSVFLSLCLLVAPGAWAQNAVPLFPCFGRPTSKGCPKILGTPGNFNPVINKDEYYDVYVESVCINRPDSWWHKKLVHVEVTVKAGRADVTVPVYSQRAGSECRIGVANFPVLTSIPSNNHRLILSAKVYRSDGQDGLKKILDFATGQQQNTALRTYESAAMPYLTMIGDFASQVYTDFAEHSEDYLYFRPMALSPEAGRPSRFDLKDEYIVFYSGKSMPGDSDVYIDRADNLRWVANSSLVAGGSTWIIFRVQERLHRRDYPNRPWYEDWEKLVMQVESRSVDAKAVRGRIEKENTLLEADQDYTEGDKRYYTHVFDRSEVEMIGYLANPKESGSDYEKVVGDSLVMPRSVGMTPGGVLITATTVARPAQDVVDLLGAAVQRPTAARVLVERTKAMVPVIDTISSPATPLNASLDRLYSASQVVLLVGPPNLTHAVISPEAFVVSLHLLNSGVRAQR